MGWGCSSPGSNAARLGWRPRARPSRVMGTADFAPSASSRQRRLTGGRAASIRRHSGTRRAHHSTSSSLRRHASRRPTREKGHMISHRSPRRIAALQAPLGPSRPTSPIVRVACCDLFRASPQASSLVRPRAQRLRSCFGVPCALDARWRRGPGDVPRQTSCPRRAVAPATLVRSDTGIDASCGARPRRTNAVTS